MAIHNETVLVVTLVGALGYYFWFYKDNPNKKGKVKKVVAKTRLTRTTAYERDLRTFQNRVKKISSSESLGAIRQDLLNLREDVAQLQHAESSDKIVAKSMGVEQSNSMVQSLQIIVDSCSKMLHEHPDIMEEDDVANQMAALNQNIGPSMSSFPNPGQFNAGRMGSAKLAQFSKVWSASQDDNDNSAFEASNSSSSKDMVRDKQGSAESVFEGNKTPSRPVPEKTPSRKSQGRPPTRRI